MFLEELKCASSVIPSNPPLAKMTTKRFLFRQCIDANADREASRSRRFDDPYRPPFCYLVLLEQNQGRIVSKTRLGKWYKERSLERASIASSKESTTISFVSMTFLWSFLCQPWSYWPISHCFQKNFHCVNCLRNVIKNRQRLRLLSKRKPLDGRQISSWKKGLIRVDPCGSKRSWEA